MGREGGRGEGGKEEGGGAKETAGRKGAKQKVRRLGGGWGGGGWRGWKKPMYDSAPSFTSLLYMRHSITLGQNCKLMLI